MEIIYVLKGSLHIKIDTDSFMLNEKEVEIINSDRKLMKFKEMVIIKVFNFQYRPLFLQQIL